MPKSPALAGVTTIRNVAPVTVLEKGVGNARIALRTGEGAIVPVEDHSTNAGNRPPMAAAVAIRLPAEVIRTPAATIPEIGCVPLASTRNVRPAQMTGNSVAATTGGKDRVANDRVTKDQSEESRETAMRRARKEEPIRPAKITGSGENQSAAATNIRAMVKAEAGEKKEEDPKERLMRTTVARLTAAVPAMEAGNAIRAARRLLITKADLVKRKTDRKASAKKDRNVAGLTMPRKGVLTVLKNPGKPPLTISNALRLIEERLEEKQKKKGKKKAPIRAFA
jgi:hypothetical protein